MNEEMLKNSADAVEENNSHIKFQKRLNELISEKYIIKNLALLSSDDHVKDLYLKFLCSILLIKGGASDDQVVFIDKLIKGSECKDSIEKLTCFSDKRFSLLIFIKSGCFTYKH